MKYDLNGFKVSFVIPKRYNDGRKIEASKWARFGAELRELQSDFTEISAGGEWQSKQDPESVVYVISVKTVKEVDALRELVRRWRSPFDQEKMYFDCLPVFFELIDD